MTNEIIKKCAYPLDTKYNINHVFARRWLGMVVADTVRTFLSLTKIKVDLADFDY